MKLAAITPDHVARLIRDLERKGLASSTIDTSTAIIEQRDYLVADIPIGGKVHRATARTNVTLTRTLRLKAFEVSLEADEGPMKVQGDVVGDTLLRYTVAAGTNAASTDTQTLKLGGPILLPTLVPLAVALEEKPRVGKSYVLPIFDAASLAPRDVRLDIRAESLFVVNDSSVFDSTSGRWHGVLPDTVRAWQIVAQSGSGVGGWVSICWNSSRGVRPTNGRRPVSMKYVIVARL